MNIILIGLPGCGKSVLGARLALALNRVWKDSDAEIEEELSLPVPEIFRRFGEERFRQAETEVLTRLLAQQNIVVSAGGGAVERNAGLLRKGGFVVYLRRPAESILATLEADSRPLLRDNPREALRRLEERRAGLYEACAHASVDNEGTVTETADRLIEILSRSEL